MGTVVEQRQYSVAEAALIREQLQRLLRSDALRSSRRSVSFLEYIVEQTLLGNAEDLKERTVGIEVFGKALTYDTNLDHAVRTAATELRKRLTIYYGEAEHKGEARILLLPGSYVPQFRAAPQEMVEEIAVEVEDASAVVLPVVVHPSAEVEDAGRGFRWMTAAGLLVVVVLIALGFGYRAMTRTPDPRQMFWQPLLRGEGPVLIAVGDVPNGPPTPDAAADGLPPSLKPATPGPLSVPFADMTTTARVAGVFASLGRETMIRRETSSSFADLRERPVVLIGAFNNEWSLRLTRELRFSLAMDSAQRVIYIRDREHPQSRAWQWSIDPHPQERERASNTPLHDYALITRLLDSDTGHEVVAIGGLYTYGTQAAGEFVSSPQLMALAKGIPWDKGQKSLQIVLETQVTEGTSGPPKVVAFHAE